MRWDDWYTDLMDVRRTETVKYGNLTRKERTLIEAGVKCRVYQDGGGDPLMRQTAADIDQGYKLACENSVDIKPGDELTVTIGGRLGKSDEVIRAFAGSPHHYYEPFGAIAPGLSHQQISLKETERI